jgi:hypothetical protein
MVTKEKDTAGYAKPDKADPANALKQAKLKDRNRLRKQYGLKKV